MKKLTALLISALLVFSLAACENGNSSSEPNTTAAEATEQQA